MEELIEINRHQNAENWRLKCENKLLRQLLGVCWVCWVVSEMAFLYLAY